VSFLSLSTDLITQAYPDQPLAVSTEATVGEVLELMRAQRGSCVLICSDDAANNSGVNCRLEGIFTERDALRWMAAGGEVDVNIRLAMTRAPTVLPATATVAAAIDVMSQRGFRHLPIVDQQGTPQGVVAVGGIVHYLVEHFPQAIYTLPPEPGKRYAQREGA
jgi:CBS domain-containing protein